MPVMMRKRGKGLQVALNILGKPANEPTGKQKSKSTQSEEKLEFPASVRSK
jgi:hypothetical protein